jgi:choline transport protein
MFISGGPARLIYGVLFIWLGTLSVFTVMGELVSMIPSAGGQYHWVFLLAPSNCRKILSYITGKFRSPRVRKRAANSDDIGWLTCIGWMASAAATSLFCSTLVQGVIIQNNQSYTPERWQVTFLFWATMVVAIFFNIVVSAALPKVEGLILVVHVVGFFAILIPLLYLGPRANTREIFTTFLNLGEWPTPGLSFFIGLAGNCVGFVGADGAVHVSQLG